MSRWTAGEGKVTGPMALMAVAVVLVLAVAAFVGVRLWRGASESALVEALDLAPADAARYSWTDWEGVRNELDADLDADSSPRQLSSFLDRAYDQDLTTASTIDDAAGLLQRGFGISPATIEWELTAQSDTGMAILLGLPEEPSVEDTVADVEDHLRELGFSQPADGSSVWSIDATELDGVDPDSVSMPALAHVALDPDDGLVLLSDDAAYLEQIVEADESGPPDDVTEAAEALADPVSAFVTTGDYACSELSLVDADPVDQAQAAELIEQAGKINPFTGFAMGVLPGDPPREVDVAMTFENDDQARTNADSRARLATGPAPGQGGTFPERFRLGETRASGNVVTMELHPKQGQQPFADLAAGSILFASC